jgi:hypothetical protein
LTVAGIDDGEPTAKAVLCRLTLAGRSGREGSRRSIRAQRSADEREDSGSDHEPRRCRDEGRPSRCAHCRSETCTLDAPTFIPRKTRTPLILAR